MWLISGNHIFYLALNTRSGLWYSPFKLSRGPMHAPLVSWPYLFFFWILSLPSLIPVFSFIFFFMNSLASFRYLGPQCSGSQVASPILQQVLG